MCKYVNNAFLYLKSIVHNWDFLEVKNNTLQHHITPLLESFFYQCLENISEKT